MKSNFYNKNPKNLLGYLMAFAMVFFSTSSAIAEDIDVNVGGGSWSSEVSWEILDSSGVSLTGVQYVGYPAWSGTIPSGCYSMEMYDSYGDGWNGSTYSISDQTTGQIYATGGLTSGAYWSDQVCWGVTGGCTDSAATNYDPLAAFDDNSCVYSCIDVYNSQSFESGTGNWVQSLTDSIDWTIYYGVTPSDSTGPNSAFDGLYYMYTESSINGTGYPNMESIMYVPCVDPTQWTQLSLVFAYHMYGATMGTLSIDVSPDTGITWIEEWTLSGNQGNQWTQTFVDLSAYSSNISVRVQAETGTSFTSDIAIDLLQFKEMPIVGCTDSSACNYDTLAYLNDGSCLTEYGCTDSTSFNYDSLATCNDGSCIPFIFGCIDSSACNYDLLANTDNGTCSFLSVSIFTTPVSCSSWNDGSVSVSTNAGMPPYTYQWSTGDTTSQVDSLPMGTYSVTVSDSLCSVLVVDSVLLNVAPADSMHPEICYVSVDNTGFNRLVLKPLANPLTASYVILRQASANQYLPLDTIDANTLEYLDSTSNPAVQAERYKVSAIDACGNNTDTSAYHKTVHLTMSLGVNGEVNLIWNSYEGYQVSSYLIYRGNSSSNMNMIGTTAGNNSSYTDLTPPTGFLQYQIRAFAQNCASIPNAFTLPDTLESNIIDHNNQPVTMNVVIQSTNPTTPTSSDGFAIADASGGTPPYTYVWTNGVLTSYNLNLGVGTYTVYVFDANNNTATASVTLTAPVSGCMDSIATNYNPNATIDNGSCIYPATCANAAPTGLHATNVVQNRATINWDNMNDANCMVDQYRIKFRAVGSSSWTQKNMGQPVNSCLWAANNTDKLILNLTPSTQYEYQMKAWYCGGGNSQWSELEYFTTEDDCPNVGNLTVTTPTTTKATFTWNGSNGAYSFTRIKARVDTNNGTWFNVGGTGVNYGTFTKNKNGLNPGSSYRAQARTWCDPNGGAYKSPTWTSLVYWTMPTVIRLEGGTTIANLAIYPNPSKDVFNITFISEEVQNLKVKVLNVIGEELISDNLEQFIGEYTKQIDLTNSAKGIYFLEIETNNGVINKKLILQ